MFKLGVLVGWRYQSPDGIDHLLTTGEAEAKFKHGEMYGRNRAPYLTPIWERKASTHTNSAEVVSFGAIALGAG